MALPGGMETHVDTAPLSCWRPLQGLPLVTLSSASRCSNATISGWITTPVGPGTDPAASLGRL